jgi:hypothetical protein
MIPTRQQFLASVSQTQREAGGRGTKVPSGGGDVLHCIRGLDRSNLAANHRPALTSNFIRAAGNPCDLMPRQRLVDDSAKRFVLQRRAIDGIKHKREAKARRETPVSKPPRTAARHWYLVSRSPTRAAHDGHKSQSRHWAILRGAQQPRDAARHDGKSTARASSLSFQSRRNPFRFRGIDLPPLRFGIE